MVQLRLLKKAKEKLVNQKRQQNSAVLERNESYLVDLFFDLEAEVENDICRDQISFESNDREQGSLIYSLLV